MGFFGASPAPNFSAAAPYMSTLTNLGLNEGGQANQYASNGNLFNATNLGAFRNAMNYLTANPATDQYNAQYMANATAGNSENAARTAANSDTNLAQRGIAPNSGPGIAAAEQQGATLAGAADAAQASLGNNLINQRGSNLEAAANLAQNAEATNAGQLAQTQGAQAGVESNLLSDADYQAMQAYQAQLAGQQGMASLMGGIGNIAASYLPLTPAQIAANKANSGN